MSGIVGSRLNIRGSGLVGSLGTDGQVFTSSGAGAGAVYEASAGFDVTSITGATALAVNPALTDEIIISDAGTLKRVDMQFISNHPAFSAKGGTLTVAANTHTLAVYDDELFDFGGNFASSRFTCPADGEGKYYFNWQWGFTDSFDIDRTMYARMRVNNVEFHWHVAQERTTEAEQNLVANSSAIVDLDEDDYVEIWLRHNDSNSVAHAASYSIFSGFRLIGEM